MQQTFKEFGNYILGVLLIIGGVTFLIIYLSAPDMEGQPIEMLFGALFLLLSGIIALPPVTARIGHGISKILMLGFFVVAAWLAWMLYNTVDEEIVFQETKTRVEEQVIQRLKDIRTAQEEYFRVKGYYASSFDSLLAFIQQPSIPLPWASGDLADSVLAMEEEEQRKFILHRDSLPSLGMTVEQAVAQGYSVRDTSYISVFDQYFSPEARAKKELPAISLDSLAYSPYSGEKFILKTGIIEVSGGVKQSVILVKDPTPFGREGVKKDTLSFGSLTEPSTSGNWGNK